MLVMGYILGFLLFIWYIGIKLQKAWNRWVSRNYHIAHGMEDKFDFNPLRKKYEEQGGGDKK